MKRVSKQISHRLYTIFVVWAMAGLCLVSCSDETRPEGAETGGGVTLTIPIALSGMEAATQGVSARGVNPGEAMQVTWGSPDGVTRADGDKLAAEMKINKLYVLQFDGTADGAKLLQCTSLNAEELSEGSARRYFIFRPSAAKSPMQTVYVVANVDLSAYVDNWTLTKSAFLSQLVKFTPTTTVPATGLPMYGSNEFDPMMVIDACPEFLLKAMVAKVNFSFSLDAVLANYLSGTFTLTLKQGANGTAYKESAGFSGAYTPSGLTRTNEISLGTLTANSASSLSGTVYLPENIAGQTTGITADKERSLTKAKAGATYIELKGKNITKTKTVRYVVFLGDPANYNDFNVKRNHEYKVTVKMKGISLTDKRATVDDDFIDLSREANGTAATANCYIVAENGSKEYGFDATVRGNGSTVAGINYATLPNLATATEARVLWQTGSTTSVVKSVTLDKVNGKVIFTTGTATEGNAVIGLFASSAANAPCLWSWHIWKVNGAPGTVLGSKTSATTGGTVDVEMMDRNLGAYNNSQGNVGSIGLIYQWGRKDPFPGPGGFNTIEPTNIYGSFNNGGTTGSWAGTYSIKATPCSTGGTEVWAVKYPTVFITYNSSTGDWMSTKNDNLWGTPWTAAGTGDYNKNQGTKSIYDPCPIGYRVPPHDTWSKQTGNGSFGSNGIILGSFHSLLWFPAAVYRNYSDGGLGYASSYGYYWSSSPSSSGSPYGGGLQFRVSDGSVWPQNISYRAYGFSVRCVSE